MVSISDRLLGIQPTAVNAILADVKELQAHGKKPASLRRDDRMAPQGGFFAMANARELGVSGAEIRTRLRYEYGPGGVGKLRVSFATGGDALTRRLALWSEGLSRIRESRS